MERDLWISLQNLAIGDEQKTLKISADTKQKRDDLHRLSLVVQGLNPAKQSPIGIKNTLPKAWRLEGRITSRINDDGTVQFFFKSEQQLLTVLEKGPWNFREWMVVVDRWSRRNTFDYLKQITFWIQILNLPDDSRSEDLITEIAQPLGVIEDLYIQEPTRDQDGEVWVRVRMDAYGRLTFVRYIELVDHEEPVLIRFIYDKLKKFCTLCGALTHDERECDFDFCWECPEIYCTCSK